MFIVKLTEQEKENLLEFLKRVQLSGVEAVSFILLVQKIAAAKPMEEMFTLELTEQERGNLLEFLKRVQLSGAETLTFISLVQKIATAKPNDV